LGTLGDLREFFGKPCDNAAFVDATYLQGDYLEFARSQVLKEPVRVLFALHAADDAPLPVQMSKSEGHPLGAILRDAVAIMLIYLVQVSPWPRR
jgi:hypothetical protein